MLTVPHHTRRQTAGKQKRAFQEVNPKPFSDSLTSKSSTRKYPLLKRLSPFLLSAMVFPLFALYTLIAGVHVFNSMWLQLFVFTGIELYLLFFDFALWNYFGGKKKIQIWVIEIVFELLVIRLFI